MEDIIYHGKVTRGWLGVQIQDVNDAMRSALGLGERRGCSFPMCSRTSPQTRQGSSAGTWFCRLTENP